MKKLLFILLVGFLSSCATIHRGNDIAGNDVKVIRNSKGEITKQIHKCQNKKIIVVYNR